MVVVLAAAASWACQRTDEENVDVALAVQASEAPAVVSLGLPGAVGLHEIALAATSALEVRDRADVVTSDAGFAAVTNVGSIGSRIGVEAQVGDVWSSGFLALESRSRVNGSVHAPEGLRKEQEAVVTGLIDSASPIVRRDLSWEVVLQHSNTSVSLEPSTSRALAPGAYGDVTVKARSTLSLTTGTYFLGSLQIESDATLTLDTQSGPIFIYVSGTITHRGLNEYLGDRNGALFAYLGTQPVALGGPFVGTVVAPQAELSLAPGQVNGIPQPGSFEGSFFASRVLVHADTTLTYSAFKYWDYLFPPQPFVVCVSKVGNGRYAALFGYENPLDVAVTIPQTSENSLSGVLTGADVGPVTSFETGRVEHALWAPFSNELTWTIRGKTATATTSSKECDASAYPTNPTPLAQSRLYSEGPSQQIAPSTPKPPDFAPRPAVSEADLSDALDSLPAYPDPVYIDNGDGTGTVQQPLETTPNFVFKFVSIKVPDGDTGSNQEPYVSTFKLDGTAYSVGSLGSCEEDTTCSLNKTVTHAVPFTQETVSIALDIDEDDDSSGDDDELEVRLTIDNKTGQVLSGTARSPDPEHTVDVAPGATCAGVKGWQVCWAVETTGFPSVDTDVSVCGFWNAYFVDEGYGEGRIGSAPPAGPNGEVPAHRAYPASFARAQVRVRSAFVPDIGAPHLAFDSHLDAGGCVKIPGRLLVHRSEDMPFSDGGLGLSLTLATFMLTPDGIQYVVRDELVRNPDYVPPSPPPPVNTDPDQWLFETWTMGTANLGPLNGIITTDSWETVGLWRVPPARIDIYPDGHTPMTNTTAALTSVLTSADPGIEPGHYEVRVNTGLRLSDGVNVDSTGSSSLLSVGPAHTLTRCAVQDEATGECTTWEYSKPSCTTSADCPSVQECLAPLPASCFDADNPLDPACLNSEPCTGQTGCFCRLPHQARWKYVVTHEAGHQIQLRASGNFGSLQYGFVCPEGTTPGSTQCPGSLSLYTEGGVVDPPWTSETCGCSHVEAANQEHCLQSIERSGEAQVEGIAQFYASRSWNNDGEGCTFAYYKEFLDSSCRSPNPEDCKPLTTLGGPMQVTLPPAAVDCREPVKWRNQEGCSIVTDSSRKAGDFGTEYDWMGFLYSINRPADVAAPKVPTSDVWLIYRHACNPPPQGSTPCNPPFSNCNKPEACDGERLVWDAASGNTNETDASGFLQGVEARYFGDDAMQAIVLRRALTYGVDADTAPQ